VVAGWCAGAAWAMVLWLVAYAVGRRQAVSAAGLHDDALPPEPEPEAPLTAIGD
jgi:undecaprenyl-diphosphatase